MLMTLISGGQRVQAIYSIRVSDNQLCPELSKLSQQIMTLLCFQIYEKEPKLCVVTHLSEYLKKIKSYRDTDKLLLTYIKSYRAISKDTISRWCKSIVKESGISIHSYTSHSSRAAASSYAKT